MMVVMMIRYVAVVDESLSIGAMIMMAIMSALIMLIMIIIMSSLRAAAVVVYAVVDYTYTLDQSRQ